MVFHTQNAIFKLSDFAQDWQHKILLAALSASFKAKSLAIITSPETKVALQVPQVPDLQA